MPWCLVLIRASHAVNSSPSIAEKLIPLLLSPASRRHIRTLLHSRPLPDLIGPLLQGRELGQVNLQCTRCTTDPRVVRNVSNGVLGSRQVGALLQTRLENRVQALGFVDVPLDAIVGADSGKEAEVVCLACEVVR